MRPIIQTCFLVLALLITFSRHADAQSISTPNPSSRSLVGHRVVDELEGFMDEFFAEQMEELHIPGAVFVLVKGDSILFKKGYGYASIDTGRKVDPDETLFQVASVSKLFTATAVMQQVELGRLDLHVDVNQYLQAFEVEEAFGTPVTLAHLLTHTAGFDDRNIGYMARDAASVQPLGTYLGERMPPRSLAPGTVTSYSNHGMALAGYIVEERSGQPFAEAIKQTIFQPLDMERSTFDLPLPAHLADALATGYQWTGETYESVPLLYRNAPPAGALSATASDMARFMMAHLQGGSYEEGQILEANSVREMQRRQFSHHPRLPGIGYGFFEHVENGYRVLHHGGDNPGYGSLLFLLPEQEVGFFVASNRLSNALRQRLVRRFMNHYYPPVRAPRVLQPAKDFKENAARFSGTYRSNRYGRRSLENLPALFVGQYFIGVDSLGYLITQDGNRWVEVEPLLFRHEEEEKYIAFREDEAGRITHLFRGMNMGGDIAVAYEKLPWYATGRFVNEFYLSWLPMLFISWIIWPVGAIWNYVRLSWKKEARPPVTPGSRGARWMAAGFGALAIIFGIGLIQPLVMQLRQGGPIFFGMPMPQKLMLWIPLLQLVLGVVMVMFCIKAWRKSFWGLPGRLHYTILMLAAGAWLLFLFTYHMVGFQY